MVQARGKEVGLESAASKILCKAHNERLSILDAEAVRAFDCIRGIFELQARQRAVEPTVWKVREWRLNGRSPVGETPSFFTLLKAPGSWSDRISRRRSRSRGPSFDPRRRYEGSQPSVGETWNG